MDRPGSRLARSDHRRVHRFRRRHDPTARPVPGCQLIAIVEKHVTEAISRAWRQLPPFGQLRLGIVNDKTDHVDIAEVRCAPTALYQSGWGDLEQAIALVLFSLKVTPRRIEDKVKVLAVVGQHALARHYERGDSSTDVAVLRDLVPVVTAWPSLIRQPGDFVIEVGRRTLAGRDRIAGVGRRSDDGFVHPHLRGLIRPC